MRTFVKMAMALGLAAWVGTSAQAQGFGRGGMGGGGGLNLLSNKGVQKELKLTDEQVDKADKAISEMRDKMRERFQDLQGLEGDERREKMEAMQKDAAKESKKTVAEILKPDQVKRYEEVDLQVRGAQAFSDEEVASKLKLTDEQKNKLKDMRAEMMTSMQELRSEFQNDREGAMKKMQELQKEGSEKAMALLTSDQKSTWKGLIGSPFDYKPEPPRQRQ